MPLEHNLARSRSQIKRQARAHRRATRTDESLNKLASSSLPIRILSSPTASADCSLSKMKLDSKGKTKSITHESVLAIVGRDDVPSSAPTTRSKRTNTSKIISRSNPIATNSNNINNNNNNNNNYYYNYNYYNKTQLKTIRTTNSNKLAFLLLVTSMSILILLTCLTNQRVSSLSCITCSSADNPGCDETYSANITDTRCDLDGKQAKVCRKIVQYVENKKVVIRSCGWIDEHEDKKPMCYKRSGTFALMMESCICYEDNCNHSASLVPNQSVLLSLACGSTIYLLYAMMMASQQQQRRRGAL